MYTPPVGWATPEAVSGTRRHVADAGLQTLQSRPLVVALMGIVALGGAFAASRWPLAAIAGAVVILALGLVISRLELAVAVLAASFFFNNYLDKGAGILTADKAIGGLAVLAWMLEWGVGRRPVVHPRQLWFIGGLIVWIGVSITVARDDQAALVTSLRYLTFFILFFLVIQTVRGDRRGADALVTGVVAAGAVAGIIGLVVFFSHHGARARGPINDPNDFGFLLASTLPLAIYRLRWVATAAGKVLSVAALTAMLACILATLSRSALIGLAVATAWALLARRVRVRWVVTALAGVAAMVGIALLANPQLAQTAFGQKTHVASNNVSTRFGYWRVALSEFEHEPVTGVGPGNYDTRFQEFAPATGQAVPFTTDVKSISGENAYLVILAELGGPGLILFLGFLVVSWMDLRRRFPGTRQHDEFQAALAAGFIVAVVGSMFLAEQYYAPLWFLSALGISMAAPLNDREVRFASPWGSDSMPTRTGVPLLELR